MNSSLNRSWCGFAILLGLTLLVEQVLTELPNMLSLRRRTLSSARYGIFGRMLSSSGKDRTTGKTAWVELDKSRVRDTGDRQNTLHNIWRLDKLARLVGVSKHKRQLFFRNAVNLGENVMEILVPAGIFVLGIIISVASGTLGVQRIIEARNNSDEQLGRTAAYAAPFKDSQHELADSITRTPKR